MLLKKSLSCSPRLCLFHQKYSKHSNTEYILKCNYFCDVKVEFSASLLQSSVSHDPSQIILIYWFGAQETFLIIINVENSSAA